MAEGALDSSGSQLLRFLKSLASDPSLDRAVIDELVKLASAGDLKRDPISRALKSLRVQGSHHETG